MYEPIRVTILAVFSLLCLLQPPQSGKDGKGGGDKKAPAEQVIQPRVRNIVRVIGRPAFIESFERTAMFPKLTAYLEKWNVDIGDRVKYGDTLATLFAPELLEDLGTKRATVQLNEQRVELARNALKVAMAGVRASEARMAEAKAILAKFEAEVDRWEAETTRLKQEVDRGVVDRKVLLESTNQLKASAAARDAAKSSIEAAAAELLGKQADVARAEVGVRVAKADLAVATSEAKRLEAWVGYLKLPAPFDGVIVARNANTRDLVQPAAGGARPIYVVARTDIVRVFVEIPEQDAKYVHIGTKATVKFPAYRDEPIAGSITRTSWALNVTNRTLRAEIDLPNPNSELLPGIYAYVTVSIEHPGVHAVPSSAIFRSDDGESTFCWTYENGRAFRTEIETGLNDGRWVEITNRRKPSSQPAAKGQASWTPIEGSERIIVGDLSLLADGAPVQVVPASEAELENPPGRDRPVKGPSGSGKADDLHQDAFGGAQLDQAAEAGSHDAIVALARRGSSRRPRL